MISSRLLESFFSEFVKIAKMEESDLEEMRRAHVGDAGAVGAAGGTALGILGGMPGMGVVLRRAGKSPSTKMKLLAGGIPVATAVTGGLIGRALARRRAKRKFEDIPRGVLESAHNLRAEENKSGWLNDPDKYPEGPTPELEKAWVNWHGEGPGRYKVPYSIRPRSESPEYVPWEWQTKHRDVLKKSYPGAYE